MSVRSYLIERKERFANRGRLENYLFGASASFGWLLGEEGLH